jgi:hypothetical protein
MGRQARRSGLVMGFDTQMIAGAVPAPSSTWSTHPTIANQTSPHFAETLAQVGATQVEPCKVKREPLLIEFYEQLTSTEHSQGRLHIWESISQLFSNGQPLTLRFRRRHLGSMAANIGNEYLGHDPSLTGLLLRNQLQPINSTEPRLH